ncbi:MAG: hypothetical protein OK404_01495 [Thaumarchaeota archaeon]|nr:hypothetical protein [Nitrososphaerota archaeon]
MPLENIFDEARRVLDEAKERKVVLKLFGGVAIYTRCPSSRIPPLARKYVDIDVIGRSKQSEVIKKLFGDLGYTPRERFNAMYGDRRLVFNDIEHSRRVDVFLDVFEMCHRFDLRERLMLDGSTIPPADLLATKLQVVEINEKDLKDLASILLDHDVGTTDGEQINGAYLAKLTSNDWGVYKTLTVNLDKLSSFVPQLLKGAEAEVVGARIQFLRKMMEEEPKALKWRLRARIGERAPWYVLPEADKEIVDSRMPETTPKEPAKS